MCALKFQLYMLLEERAENKHLVMCYKHIFRFRLKALYKAIGSVFFAYLSGFG